MVSFIEKFLLVLGLLKRLDSESTFEVVRHMISGWGRTKLFFFDPRISFDDQNFKNDKIENLFRFKESLDDLI